MKFHIIVLASFIGLNQSEPTKDPFDEVDDSNVTEPILPVTTFSSIESINSGIEGNVDALGTPHKLDNDKNLYRVIRLSNGLKALLISMQQNELTANRGSNKAMEHWKAHPKKAACNLNVDVGSFSNPRDVQGLGHLVEHVTFTASEKYPSENEILQFLRKSGGDYYARIDSDYTAFSFETHEEFLDEALDRFSDFFKAPLLRNESLVREREAVDSEFASKKYHDGTRLGELLKSLGEPTHPASMFQWGNLETLKDNIDDDELYRKVQEFRKRHYSAHRMYLCLQSDRSLDDLQELVVRRFSTIPSNDMPGVDFSAFTHLNAFQPKFHDKVYYVKPMRRGSNIMITWCLEPMLKKFQENTKYILSYLFLRDGEGSLLSYLRKKLWATELLAWDDELGYKANTQNNRIFTTFELDIRLTERGFDHLDDVVAAVFSYMKFLQQINLNESTFHELRTAFANVRRFSSGLGPWDNVKYLGKNMLYYPAEFIVTAPNYLFDYDADAIKKTIDYMNLRKFNVMITLRRSKSNQLVYNLIEPRFGIKYTEIDMPAKWIELHQKVEPFSEFTLPVPNPFIADNFTLLHSAGPRYAKPIKILSNRFFDLWYRRSTKILRPHAKLRFIFMRTFALTSIDNEIQMTLLASWLKHQLADKLYPATLAGIKYTCEPLGSGIDFEIAGFNQKLHLVADIFAKTLKTLAKGPIMDEFKMLVQQQFDIFEKELLDPWSVAWELHSNVALVHYHPLWEKYKRLQSISFLNFLQFCRDFCVQAELTVHASGNIDKSHAINIMRSFLDDFQCKRSINTTRADEIPKKLPFIPHYLRVRNFNARDVNSVIVNFYQIGSVTRTMRLILELLEMMARESVFNILRFKDQLSFDFGFGCQFSFGIWSLYISVSSQEKKFTADYVDERIENFRGEFLSIIGKMPLVDFTTFKESMAKNKWIEFDRNVERMEWNSHSDEDEFISVTEEVEHLLSITKAQFLEFCRTILGVTNQRKLSVQVIGNKHADEDDKGTVDIVGSFESLTFANFTGKPKGILVKDLIKFRNSLDDYN